MIFKRIMLAMSFVTPLWLNSQTVFSDTTFRQEYHEGYLVGSNDSTNIVRSIVVDDHSNIFIATVGGVFVKNHDVKEWKPLLPVQESGPAYAVAKDNAGDIWISTWKSLFVYRNRQLKRIEGLAAPISVLCVADEGMYALGPNGVWIISGDKCVKEKIQLPGSIRHAVSDGASGLWVASDVGLYHANSNESK
jgi:ligand-binding sensor domain-containing protein